ncbi:MAG: hypothetical protein MRJ93_11415 [Nitrososphaeraceae archaeon]|nr:hypothetical protein [Nitrososphaeraceae archaeon]
MIEQKIIKRGYIPHIRHRREVNKLFQKKHPTRRWVVERTNSWHYRFRKLFRKYEKKDKNCFGLVELANSLIVYRRLILGYPCELFPIFYFISYFLSFYLFLCFCK